MFTEIKILICGSLLLLPHPSFGRYYTPSENQAQNSVYPAGYKIFGSPSSLPYAISKWPSDAIQNCAVLYDQANYRGRSISLKDNEKNPHLGLASIYVFLPQSVQVQRGCSITTYDQYGTIHKYGKDTQWIGSQSYPVSAGCCECGGCDRAEVYKDLACARLYEHEKCSGCEGYRLDLKDGDKVKFFGVLDNKMSSIAVRPGCEVIVYYERDFQGYKINLTKNINLLGDNWIKHISSAQCFCPNIYYPSTQQPPIIYPTYSPPVTVTLPVIVTEKATVTLPVVTESQSSELLPSSSEEEDEQSATTPNEPVTVTLPFITQPVTVTLPIVTEPTTVAIPTESTEEEDPWPPSSEEEDEQSTTPNDTEEDFKSEEIPTTPSTTTTTTPSAYSEESSEDENEDEWGEDDDWENHREEEIEKITTTEATTIQTKGTTTEAPKDEEEGEDEDWNF